MTTPESLEALRRHGSKAVLLSGPTSGAESDRPSPEVFDQHAPDPAPAPAVPPAPAGAPVVEQTPAGPSPAELAERRRTAEARRIADALRTRARGLTRWARFWMGVVIVISIVITTFGAGNAHAVFLRHDTADPWAWLPYPALEAALIVEIQIGGLLAEHKRRVVFWGEALRAVTAVAAITLCFLGPAEERDWIGAGIHALGPFAQFWLAEFLAHARPQFRAAVEDLQAQAAGRERAAETTAAAGGPERPARSRKRSRTGGKAGRTPAAPAAGRAGLGDQAAAGETATELVLTGPERKARAAMRRDRVVASKRTVTAYVRAAGGAIGTTRALVLAAAWKGDLDGPELHAVAQNGDQ